MERMVEREERNRDAREAPGAKTAGGPIVALEGVSVVRDGRPLLQDVTWRVAPGERWAVLGLNGAGKSTLLRLLSGRLFPTRGTVRLFGHRLGTVPVEALQAKIGWIGGELKEAFGPESPREIVALGRRGAVRPPERPAPAVLAAAGETLAAVGLDGAAMDRPYATLSDGERARTLLARALFSDPALFVFDEPTAGLDLFAREALLETIDRRLSQTNGAAVYVTHHLEEVLPLFDRVLLLRRGEVFFAGPRSEALTEGRLRAFYGRPIRLYRFGDRVWALPEAPAHPEAPTGR
ncbi:ATP-binding cassette domain-containing protein [Hydrogenibacillus sp. N12]|uniref:ABC transporter ATP-binding protein n=1 Tax=Hydrogenibacillus sp. N12 TaxID=2866627 RepID=UPI001C7D7844|nr:ATP-binding cassette domain-containing protein [Hydrogenibacillus sp. N12]QZA32961.1 ATP-binding cassette domain-containing protein [Hydrogenibacillus sp. N12]